MLTLLRRPLGLAHQIDELQARDASKEEGDEE
jgi:hypothetical protein